MKATSSGLRREIWNLPNAITIGRLFLIPPVLWLLDLAAPMRSLVATALFIGAAVLDVVDGWLARKRDEVTFFGKFMDPLADKVMVGALLIFLVAHGRLAPWVAVLLVSREFYISGLRMLALNERIEIPAGAGGKAKTTLQVAGIAGLMLAYTVSIPLPGTRFGLHELGTVLVYSSLVVSVWSAYDYTRGFTRQLDRQ